VSHGQSTLDPGVAPPAPASRGAGRIAVVRKGGEGTHRARGRRLTAVVIITSLIATVALQHVTQVRHHDLVRNTGAEAKASNLNSFSLALMLGGLRGPLVMMLWTSSESQKQEKELEDFNSKIELIRLLQPEFDSVTIFQTWNLAYNISVQMANKPNKYAAILDAIEYGYKSDRQRPNNVNIITQIGQLFFDKLGNSTEKDYYTDRVRRDSFPDVRVTVPSERVTQLDGILARAGVEPGRRETMVQQAGRNGWFMVNKLAADAIRPLLNGPGVTYAATKPQVYSDTGRLVRLDPMLDVEGNLLAELVTPVDARPAKLPAGAEWNDGSEFQYLKQFGPYPYGLHPMAIGWNYYKRAQVLKDLTHQKHLQLSDTVVDNRPAINLKLWGEAEWGAGRRMEMLALGMPLPTTENTADFRAMIEQPTAQAPPTAAIADVADAREAVYHYEIISRIVDAAEREYARHARHHAGADYTNHREPMAAMKLLCQGDAEYLKAMLTPREDEKGRQAHLADAKKQYDQAVNRWEVIMLKYDISDEIATKTFPKGLTKDNLNSAPPAQVHLLASAIARMLDGNRQYDGGEDERRETDRYIRRAVMRLLQIDRSWQAPG
jgi:hypothetical protein